MYNLTAYGTSNYAGGIFWFGIMITLFEENMPVITGIYLPADDIFYLTEIGKGLFRNNIQMNFKRPQNVYELLIAFSIDFSDDKKFIRRVFKLWKRALENSRGLKCTNSLLDFIFVAEGKYGGCINFNAKIWDIASFKLIFNELGLLIRDVNNREIKFKINNNQENIRFIKTQR